MMLNAYSCIALGGFVATTGTTTPAPRKYKWYYLLKKTDFVP